MKTLKKFLLIALLVFIGLILVFTGLNLFDEAPRHKHYTLKDFPSAPKDNTNGFFILWGLAEPDNVDVLSDRYIDKVLSDNNSRSGEVQDLTGSLIAKFEKNKSKFSRFHKWTGQIRFPRDTTFELHTVLAPQAEAVENAKRECGILLKRYRLLIDSPIFIDLCSVDYDAPIPNLLAWRVTADLYNAVYCLDAVNGNWLEATRQLLDHLDFGKRAYAGSRRVLNQIVARKVIFRTLGTLVSIMNHPQCPPEVYQLVLSRMPPIKYEEYGNRNHFIAECLQRFAIVDMYAAGKIDLDESILLELLPTSVFLQKNRTKNYFYDYFSTMIAFDKKPPHLWKSNPPWNLRKRVHEKKSFWWVQNPKGKIILSYAAPQSSSIFFKSLRLRATYDMTRILAEFHSKYTPGSDVKAILAQLDTYKTIDLCSGKPYRYSAGKKLLYGIGLDRKDDGGFYKIYRIKGVDFPVPLAVKKQESDTHEDDAAASAKKNM